MRTLHLHVRITDRLKRTCTISVESSGDAITPEIPAQDMQDLISFFNLHPDLLLGEADPSAKVYDLRLALANRDDVHVPIVDSPSAYVALGLDVVPQCAKKGCLATSSKTLSFSDPIYDRLHDQIYACAEHAAYAETTFTELQGAAVKRWLAQAD